MATSKEILRRLRGLRSEENLAGMARFGIRTGNALGVPLSVLRTMAREHHRDHALALDLWETGVREARVLAFLIDDPRQVTAAQMERWVRDFDSWDICDGCILHLFRKTPFAWTKAFSWPRSRAEFVRRAGFTLMAVLAVHDKQAPDERFVELLPIIEGAADDDRNFVKKAVNWALRQIGKRNAELRVEAMDVARRLAESPHASARWIGRDAIREFGRIPPRPIQASKND